MLRALTGAERATITTSNAASLLLIGGALASGRDIVVAARDLIEISEGVRVRDIVEASGARVVPVGAANCVNVEDFRRAITPATAVLMRSHASNVAATGYVEHVADADLGRLAQERGVPFVVNLGGGSLVDLTERGLPECPTISQAILMKAGDVLFFNGLIVHGLPNTTPDRFRRSLIGHYVCAKTEYLVEYDQPVLNRRAKSSPSASPNTAARGGVWVNTNGIPEIELTGQFASAGARE